ncbi:MAG: serine hydrolase [Candidatus Sumerlaeota bacterium]|nr:serine hydrolase [Candidatus Sumerlaeota bacterium]
MPTWECLSPEKIGALRDSLAQNGTKALLVIRNDRIVCEWYAEGFSAERPHYTASLAKAVVGGLSLMLAVDDRRISIDDPACRYVPAWKSDPVKSRITVRQLATHTSGLEDANEDGRPHESLPGWKGAFWKRAPDPFTVARDQAPVLFEPGTAFSYSNPGMAMLSYAVTASLRGAPQEDIRSLLRERILRPIGVEDGRWTIGYGKTYDVDGLPLVANWGGASFTARDMARLGRLLLRKGDWDGTQLLRPETVEAATTPPRKSPVPDRSKDKAAPLPGWGWWCNRDGAWPSLPIDAIAGLGAGHQTLLVVPCLDLIVVRYGGALGEPYHEAAAARLFAPLAEAVLPPAAPSPVITRIEWAPASEIVRKAKDSDTWPSTWADDGNLYVAWADGRGFEPFTEEKLGLGMACISGFPPDFAGVNIRSAAVENKGMGPKGEKASGMLMVGGVLHMWARNADHAGRFSRLAWSTDHAAEWTWSDWMFQEFGYCTFLNFGRNYEGARDGFVYVYSHDNPSAYTAADRMILLRVPRERIRDRAAYEFFVQRDERGDPVWSKEAADRGAVFAHAKQCMRSSVSFHAPSGRYLWWQQRPVPTSGAPDTRFHGGFGVYDAPEPWGPWTTVYDTLRWDVGPGETGCFPTKWMSPDGRTIHLLFSGNDYCSVRRATLTIKERGWD